MKGLDGKVALVTGGGKGLGQAFALALAARGVRIVVTGRSERALGETVGEIAYGGGKARHVPGDVRDRASVTAAVDRAFEVFGGLDIVLATASVYTGAGDGSAVLATNLLGAWTTFEAALTRMKGPGLLLAASAVEEEAGAPHTSAAGDVVLEGLRIWARRSDEELAPRGIRCHVLPRPASLDDVRMRALTDRVLELCAATFAS